MPGPLKVGDLLADRYLLLEATATDGPAVLWRANDEVLARAVAAKVVATANKAGRDAAEPFLAAAARSGAVNHPGLVRVYDAAPEARPGRGNDVAYVLSEWVDGEPLDAHLERVGALSAPDATDVLRQVADALTAAHEQGLVHGRLHPRNVLITPGGRVRLTDAAVASALHDPQRDAAPADDVRDLAAVLYALTTGRWPAAVTPQPAGGLSEAPIEGGHLLTPRQLRAGVPRALDGVVTRVLEPGRAPTLSPLRTAAAVADAADEAVAEMRQSRAEAAVLQPPTRLRQATPWLAAASFVTAVGVVGWLVGLAVGDLPANRGAIDAIVSTTQAPTPGVNAPLDLKGLVVRDFDPEGTDGQENTDQVPNATDGVPATAWTTSRYKSETFGGLKTGVGLLLDLGKPTDLHTVQVGFTATGAKVEVRVSDTAPTRAGDLTTVAAGRDGTEIATLRPLAGTKARYVLIWITSLPKEGDGYRVGIAELRLT